MVVITHELESIKILADRVIMLADNQIQAIGTVEELSESSNERVYDFFHRIAPRSAGEGSGSGSVLDQMGGGGA